MFTKAVRLLMLILVIHTLCSHWLIPSRIEIRKIYYIQILFF